MVRSSRRSWAIRATGASVGSQSPSATNHKWVACARSVTWIGAARPPWCVSTSMCPCTTAAWRTTRAFARHFLPAVAGLLMEKEIVALGSALEYPRHPFVGIIGGAKVSSKLAVLENLIDRVDRLLIGGGMANTFLRAQGQQVGKSLLEADLVDTAAGLLRRGDKIVLPLDVVVTTDLKGDAAPRTCAIEAVGLNEMIVDVGPRTIGAFKTEIEAAGTVLWNGPMGIFEDARFAAGTLGIARAMATSKATTVVGGGES